MPSSLPFPLRIHQDGHFNPGTTFRWDEKQEKYFADANERWKYASLLNLIFSLLGIYSFWSFSSGHDMVKAAYSTTVLNYSFWGGWVFICLTVRTNEALKFLNNCRELEKWLGGRGIELPGSKFGNILIQAFRVSSFVIPALYAVGALLIPCFPVNLFAAIQPTCVSIGCPNGMCWVWVCATTLLSWLAYSIAIRMGFVVVTHILVGVLVHIWLLKGFQRFLKLRVKKDTVILYRSLQLLNGLFNASHSAALLFCLIAMMEEEAIWAYVLIRAPASEFPTGVRIAVAVMLVEITAVSLIVYRQAGSIYGVSEDVLRDARQQSWVAKDVSLKRSLVSCAKLRMAFGANNFLEKDTSIKCFSFTVGRFADLLIMEK